MRQLFFAPNPPMCADDRPPMPMIATLSRSFGPRGGRRETIGCVFVLAHPKCARSKLAKAIRPAVDFRKARRLMLVMVDPQSKKCREGAYCVARFSGSFCRVTELHC